MDPVKCASHHLGPWMVEPEWFSSAVASVKSGMWKPKGETTAVDGEGEPADSPIYRVVNGVAVIPMAGPMMKARSKYGGTSTVDTRSQVRRAAADPAVAAILLHIDSPGGTVAGTEALAQDVAAADKSKPVHAHIEDMGASAAYYVASQARRITASKGSLVGSLGAMMVLQDLSKMADMKGIKVHAITSGGMKGAATDGTEITAEQLAYFQRIVDDSTAHFKAAVAAGRGLDAATTDALFDGQVRDAEKAKTLGLIDEVTSLDATLQAITQEIHNMDSTQFRKFAAEHPEDEAVKEERQIGMTAGLAQGVTQERTRANAILSAHGLGEHLAAASITAGHDAATAATIATAAAKAKTDAESAAKVTADAKDAEITRLRALAEAGGHKGVTQKTDATAAPLADDSDPAKKAKAEWDANANGVQQAFHSEGAYIAYRKADLSGQIKHRGTR